MKIENLEIRVTYTVSLGDVEVPDEVYEQLQGVHEEEYAIVPGYYGGIYDKALDWIERNAKESDCTDWMAEVTEFE